eukprot:s3107_g6.t1
MWRLSVVFASFCHGSAEVEPRGSSIPASYCPLEDVIDFYENALAFTDPFFRETSLPFIRAHLPTLLEYARRSGSIAELGVGEGWSSVAFIRAALERSTHAELAGRYRYRMYDIARSPKLDMIFPFVVNCSNVDFEFHEGDVLNQTLLDQVGDEQGPFPPVDLLFIDTLHTFEQLTAELEAFARNTNLYIILHDMESFGKHDEFIHDTVTSISYQRKKKRLAEQEQLHLQTLMQQHAVSSVKDLDRHLREEAKQKAAEDLAHRSGLQNALRFWLQGPAGGEWEILEHSLADNGLTVLGRIQPRSISGTRPLRQNSTEHCRRQLQQIGELARLQPLLVLSPDASPAATLDKRGAEELKRLLSVARRLCPGQWEVRAAMQLLQWHMQGIHRRPAAPIGTAQRQSADFFFATLAQHGDQWELPAQWIDWLEESVTRWPFRLEGWFLLAKHLTSSSLDPPRAVHAWRRAYVLCQRNRWVALAAVEALSFLGHGDEAENLRKGISDVFPLTEKMWEPHLQSVPASKSNFRPAEFQMARRLVEDNLPRIRNELELLDRKKLPAPKCDGAMCEQILLENSARNVSSPATCILLPQLCRTLQEVEAHHGLRVLASSMVEANDPMVPVPQFPGRLRLCCARMMHVLDSCFWLNEAVSRLQITSISSRQQFFVVDFRDPTEETHPEIGETFHSLLWLQTLLVRIGDGSSLGLLEAKPARFQVRESWGMREIFAPYAPSFKGQPTGDSKLRLTFICEAV